MSNFAVPSCSILLTVEIELPGDLSDEHLDALVEDLTEDGHVERLALLIKRWARFITGENCHVAIDTE